MVPRGLREALNRSSIMLRDVNLLDNTCIIFSQSREMVQDLNTNYAVELWAFFLKLMSTLSGVINVHFLFVHFFNVLFLNVYFIIKRSNECYYATRWHHRSKLPGKYFHICLKITFAVQLTKNDSQEFFVFLTMIILIRFIEFKTRKYKENSFIKLRTKVVIIIISAI